MKKVYFSYIFYFKNTDYKSCEVLQTIIKILERSPPMDYLYMACSLTFINIFLITARGIWQIHSLNISLMTFQGFTSLVIPIYCNIYFM